MKITIIAIDIVMLAYFLVLYGAVGFIQDKRFFGSAPKENLAAIPDQKQRFRGAAFLCVWDGIRNEFGFAQFFVRFLIVLCGMEINDILFLFFDWVLLCHSNFFPHFYPELKGVVGPHMFGYNANSHIRHFIIYLPASAAAAAICALL